MFTATFLCVCTCVYSTCDVFFCRTDYWINKSGRYSSCGGANGAICHDCYNDSAVHWPDADDFPPL